MFIKSSLEIIVYAVKWNHTHSSNSERWQKFSPLKDSLVYSGRSTPQMKATLAEKHTQQFSWQFFIIKWLLEATWLKC